MKYLPASVGRWGVLLLAASTTVHAQTLPVTPTPSADSAPLSLGAAFQAALTTPVATSAQQQFAQAQARVAQTQAQLRSQITLSSTVGVSNASVIQPPPAHETFGSVVNTLAIPLTLGRKPRLAVAQSVAQLGAAQAQQSAARLALATQVSTTYYDLLRKQALLQIARDTLTTAERQQSDAEKRFRAGDVSELDVTRARSPVATAQAGIVQAENAVTVARETLNSVIGKPLDSSLAIADVPAPTTETVLSMTLEDARRAAREASPDVQAADANVNAARLGRRIAGLSREPTYSLEVSDARSNDQTGFSRLNTVQATITVPLTDGGLAKAQQKEAEAALAQAEAQAKTARLTAEVTVSTAYLNASSSLRQIEAARTAQEIAQTAYDKTSLGYREGLFTLTDVQTAQSALTQARIAYTQAIYDAAVAATTLNNALGVLPK